MFFLPLQTSQSFINILESFHYLKHFKQIFIRLKTVFQNRKGWILLFEADTWLE